MYLSASYILEKEQYDRRDQELECLCKQVINLKLEVQGRCRRRNRGESPKDFSNTGESRGEFYHQSGSHQSRERSCEFADRLSNSPNQHKHHSAAMDAMSWALQRVAQSIQGFRRVNSRVQGSIYDL